MDQVTVLHLEPDGHWHVWLSDPSATLGRSMALNDDEHAVLALYLHNHTDRTIYMARRDTQRPPQES